MRRPRWTRRPRWPAGGCRWPAGLWVAPDSLPAVTESAESAEAPSERDAEGQPRSVRVRTVVAVRVVVRIGVRRDEHRRARSGVAAAIRTLRIRLQLANDAIRNARVGQRDQIVRRNGERLARLTDVRNHRAVAHS